MKQPVLKVYYALTPLLWALDLMGGINIRAAAFEGHPLAKNLYYAFCMGCALILWKGYAWSNVVTLTESSLSCLLLILGYLGPYYRILDGGIESGLAVPSFSIAHWINFVFSSGATYLSFHQAVNAITPRPSRSSTSK